MKPNSLLRAVLLMTICLPYAASAAYSEGYRMGYLNKFSVKGMVNESGEGELMLGNESTLFQWVSGSGDGAKARVVNPWYFSVAKENANILERMNSVVDNFVVIHYKSGRPATIILDPFAEDSTYQIISIEPLSMTKAKVKSLNDVPE